MPGKRSITLTATRLLVSLLLAGWAIPHFCAADRIIFSNGDERYGKILGYTKGHIIVELDGQRLEFSTAAIKGFQTGVDKPAGAPTLKDRTIAPSGVAEMIQRATGVDINVSKRKLGEDRELTVVSEKDIAVPWIGMGYSRSSFFGRLGSYIQGTIRNDAPQDDPGGFNYSRVRGYDFVLHAFDTNDKLVASQRFYLVRFPPGRAISFKVEFPFLNLNRIKTVKVTRRF